MILVRVHKIFQPADAGTESEAVAVSEAAIAGSGHGDVLPRGLESAMFGTQALLIDAVTSSIESIREKRAPAGAGLQVNKLPLLSDVSALLLIIAVAAGPFGVAELVRAAPQRNPAADEIAERFAGPEASESERFNFAPLLRAFSTLEDNATGSVEIIEPPDAKIDAGFGALGAVIVRNLPPGSSFSRGRRTSPTEWALAQDDLADLTLTLPATQKHELSASIDVYDQSGVASGKMELRVRQGPEMLSKPGPGTAIAETQTSKRRVTKPVRSLRKMKVKFKPSPRRPVVRTAKAQAAAAPETGVLPGLFGPLFKPAAGPPQTEGQSGADEPPKVSPGVYPRQPMEEEALRR